MSDVDKFATILSERRYSFFHFADTRNLPSIRQHGLLSMQQVRQRNLIVAPGGNDWSMDADRRCGMDRYVHLCFFREHPMEWLARQDGRIKDTRFLKVHPGVIRAPGTLITDRVSNKADAWPRPAEEMMEKLDLEVIYTQTDWKDPKIQARLKAARVCEILIPNHVSISLIKNAH